MKLLAFSTNGPFSGSEGQAQQAAVRAKVAGVEIITVGLNSTAMDVLQSVASTPQKAVLLHDPTLPGATANAGTKAAKRVCWAGALLLRRLGSYASCRLLGRLGHQRSCVGGARTQWGLAELLA